MESAKRCRKVNQQHPDWFAPTYDLRSEVSHFVAHYEGIYLTPFDLISDHIIAFDRFLENETKNLDNHWIIKAWNLAHGTSTKIVKSLAEIMTMRKTITPYTISKYIERPFLERLHIFKCFLSSFIKIRENQLRALFTLKILIHCSEPMREDQFGR